METIGGECSKTGLFMKKKENSTTGIGASLTPDYRETEKSNTSKCITHFVWVSLYLSLRNHDGCILLSVKSITQNLM